MGEAEETEKEIEARSNEYRPVAKRASLLYFCLADLAVVSLLVGLAGARTTPGQFNNSVYTNKSIRCGHIPFINCLHVGQVVYG